MWKIILILLFVHAINAERYCFQGYHIDNLKTKAVSNNGLCVQHKICSSLLVNDQCMTDSIYYYNAIESLKDLINGYNYNITSCSNDYCNSPNISRCYVGIYRYTGLSKLKQGLNVYNRSCYMYHDVCRYTDGDCSDIDVKLQTPVLVYGIGNCDILVNRTKDLYCCTGHLCNIFNDKTTSITSDVSGLSIYFTVYIISALLFSMTRLYLYEEC